MLAKTVDSKFQSSNMVKHVPLVTRLHSPTKALRLSREAFACLSPWGVSTKSLPLTDSIRDWTVLVAIDLQTACTLQASHHPCLPWSCGSACISSTPSPRVAFFWLQTAYWIKTSGFSASTSKPSIRAACCTGRSSSNFTLNEMWVKGKIGICLIPMGTVNSNHHLVSLTSCITVYK